MLRTKRSGKWNVGKATVTMSYFPSFRAKLEGDARCCMQASPPTRVDETRDGLDRLRVLLRATISEIPTHPTGQMVHVRLRLRYLAFQYFETLSQSPG